MVSISYEDCENLNLLPFRAIMATIERQGKRLQQKVAITFDGYNDIPQDVHEIPTCIRYMRALYAEYPYIAYYLSDRLDTLRIFMACLGRSTSLREGHPEVPDPNRPETFKQYMVHINYSNVDIEAMYQAMKKHAKRNHDPKGADRSMMALFAEVGINAPNLNLPINYE